MTLFAGAAQVQKAYVGASAVNAIMNSGVNVLGVNGSFPGITDSELYLPLTNTLVPTRGSSTPTFTRATAAWDFDSEGKLNLNIPSGCPRFTGARLVRNLLTIPTEDLTSAGWTKADTTITANAIANSIGEVAADKLVESATTAAHTVNSLNGFSVISGVTYRLSVEVKKAERTKSFFGVTTTFPTTFISVDLDTGVVATAVGSPLGAKSTNLGNDWWRVEFNVAATSTGFGAVDCRTSLDGVWANRVFLGEITKGIFVTRFQIENVTGQADQTASEYVSVGVLSAPFHGAGVDGCKYFTTNKDGSAIPSATLKGYLAEPSRVNNCLRSRDASHATWTKSNITATLTVTGLDNVANSASRLTAAANDATLLQLLTAATGTRTTSVWIKRVSGSGTVSLTRNGGTGWTDITSSLVTGTWVPVSLTSDVGANPTVGLKMGTSGDVIDVDCFQDENGAWRTSPILTTTAAVTRNADVLSYASAFDVAQGTALCQVRSAIPINSGSQATLLDSAACVMLYLTSTSARTSTGSYDGTNSATIAGCGDITTGVRKRAVRWGADLKISGDSSLGAATAFDGAMGSTGTLEVGSENSISQISGNIGEVHVWTSALTDAQMQQVTS